MINIKYYLTLLISVFLSLGIGIIIGISLESKDVLEKQQNTIAQRLEEEFIEIRNENRQLKEMLASLEESEQKNTRLYESLFNAIVKNKLDGLRVALIEAGDDRDFSSLISLLKISGASIESNITFGSRLFRQNTESDNAIDVLAPLGLEKTEFYDELAGNIIDSLSIGQYTDFLESLMNLNLLHSSIDIQDSCDAIILAYGGMNHDKEGIERLCDNLIELSSDYRIPIILVQNADTNLIDLRRYKKKDISTVDHVDTLHGRLSLVSLLYGNRGNYGYGVGSDGILPDEIFPTNVGYSPSKVEDIDQDIQDDNIYIDE